MKKAYVYRHRRLDTGKVFYVGKGSGDRAHMTEGRNRHWNAVAAKTEFMVEIVTDNLSEEDAFELEVFMIEEYGLENLCNMTEGGNGGMRGYKHSKRSREKISQAGRRPCSEEVKKKISSKLKGRGPRSQEVKNKISKANRGKPGPMKGRKHTEETRKRISENTKGKKRTEEQRKKMSIATTLMWKKRKDEERENS